MKKLPDNPVAAKKWVQAAMEAGRYVFASSHFPQRLRERGETMDSVKRAIARAERVEPYPSMAELRWHVLAGVRRGNERKEDRDRRRTVSR